MAIFKEQLVPRKDPPLTTETPPRKDTDSFSNPLPSYEPAVRPRPKDGKETVIAAGLTIDGKIEGSGHVRMGGRFKGDVNINRQLPIAPRAPNTAPVRASRRQR